MTGEDSLTAGQTLERAKHRLSEETINQLTHGSGAVLSLLGSIFLCWYVWSHGNTWQIAGCTVYCLTLMSVYGASTLSHSFEHNHARRHFWRTIDQVCIFLLIAGTYTPFALTYLREDLFLWLLTAEWGLALVGVFFKLFHARLNNVTTVAYVLLGWLPMIAVRQILQRVPPVALGLVLLGGALYTIGVLFLNKDDKVRYFHGVWHILVIAASICHFVAVFLYATSPPQAIAP